MMTFSSKQSTSAQRFMWFLLAHLVAQLDPAGLAHWLDLL